MYLKKQSFEEERWTLGFIFSMSVLFQAIFSHMHIAQLCKFGDDIEAYFACWSTKGRFTFRLKVQTNSLDIITYLLNGMSSL